MQNEQGANTVDQFAEKIMQQYPDLTARPIRKVSASEGQILEKIKGLMGLISLVNFGACNLMCEHYINCHCR